MIDDDDSDDYSGKKGNDKSNPLIISKSINYTKEEFINNKGINLIEYQIILYSEQKYSITLVNDIKYTMESFEAKIISHFIEEYTEFNDLSNLRIVRYLKPHNKSFTPITLDIDQHSLDNLPNPLYIEMTSSDGWVKVDCNIELNSNHSIQSYCELRLERNSTWKTIEPTLLKTIISLWNNACRENSPELLRYHYIVTEYKLYHTIAQKEIWCNETKYFFSFQLSVKLIMRSVEELAFHSLQDEFLNITEENKWETFRNMESFDHFAMNSDLEVEFDLLNTLVRSEIFKLNKANKVYIFFSTNKLDDYDIEDSLSSSSSEDNNTRIHKKEMNLVISPVLTKEESRKNPNQCNSTRITYEYLSPQISTVSNNNISTINNNQEKQSLSKVKNYKEVSADDYFMQIDERKDDDEYIYKPTNRPKRVKQIKSREGLNFAAKTLYKSYQEEQEFNTPIKNRGAIVSVDGGGIELKVITSKEPQMKKIIKNDMNQIQSIMNEFHKVLTQTFVLNLIVNNSKVQMQKLSLAKYAIPKSRGFKYKNYIVSSLKSLKEQTNEKLSNWGSYLFLIISLSIVGFIFYKFQ